MKKVTIIITILFFNISSAQDEDPKAAVTDPAPVEILNPINDFFKKLSDTYKISVRKSFESSSKDEAKPATFFWNNDDENSFRYLTVDIGVKVKEFDLMKDAKYLISPKFEWHRDDVPVEDKKKDNISGGFNIDLMPFTAEGIVPFFTGSLDYKNDYIKKLETFNSKFYISTIGGGSGFPHEPMRVSGHIFLEYQIYTGFEYYESLTSGALSSCNWANRIFVDLRPIPALSSHFQITADFSHRTILSDSLYNKKDLSWLALGANIYLNSEQNIGIGIEYTLGDDPTSNFVDTNKTSFGIKFKI